MRLGLLIFVCTFFFIGCTKNESNENFKRIKHENLKTNLDGNYELISSFSGDAVDLNMDGIMSTNLLVENPKLSESFIGIKILDYELGYSYFEEMWPMASSQVSRDEIFDTEKVYSTYGLNYDSYYNTSTCVFNDDHTSIQLLDDVKENKVNTLISIDAISIEENEIIKVKTTRRLYTVKGWLTSQIESRYKRTVESHMKNID